MPIRQRFGNWTGFVVHMGLEPLKPTISPQAKKASIRALKAKTQNRKANWTGNEHIDHNGYITIYAPKHPNTTQKGYMGKHRFVMSEHLSRPLKDGETVHHKDGNRKNNKIENLELWTTNHPSGQKVSDKIDWAIKFLKEYGYEINKI